MIIVWFSDFNSFFLSLKREETCNIFFLVKLNGNNLSFILQFENVDDAYDSTLFVCLTSKAEIVSEKCL